MTNLIFVPVTDELLYEHAEFIPTPLRPYHTGLPCFHWMAEIEYVDKSTKEIQIPGFMRKSKEIIGASVN